MTIRVLAHFKIQKFSSSYIKLPGKLTPYGYTHDEIFTTDHLKYIGTIKI